MLQLSALLLVSYSINVYNFYNFSIKLFSVILADLPEYIHIPN